MGMIAEKIKVDGNHFQGFSAVMQTVGLSRGDEDQIRCRRRVFGIPEAEPTGASSEKEQPVIIRDHRAAVKMRLCLYGVKIPHEGQDLLQGR